MESEHFSKQSFDCLKGLFALVILSHHLYQNTHIVTNKFLCLIFQNMGVWAVGIYLFISGFGLYYSYLNKGDDYIASFPRNRILPFYLICVTLVLIYLGINMFIDNPVTTEKILYSLSFGGTIIKHGWYLQTILFVYIAFWFAFRFFATKKKVPVIMTVVVIYALYKYGTGALSTSYETVLCVLAGGGAYWLNLRRQTPRKLFSVVIFVLFASSFIMRFVCSKYNLLYLSWPFTSIANISFCFFVVSIDNIKLIRNRLFEKLGEYSLEIYTLQGLWILVFHSEKIYINNAFSFAILVSVCTFASSYVFHFWTKKIYKICRR